MRIIVVIAICLVIAMVMFGKNPYKAALEKEKRYGDDPLVNAINRYNEKNEKNSMFGGFGFGAKQPRVNQNNADEEYPLNEIPAPVYNAPAPPRQTNNNYYPPIADGQSVATSSVAVDDSSPRLRSGQVIGFNGAEVFVPDASGKHTPLPDGSYTLYDGSKIQVQNGKRVTGNY